MNNKIMITYFKKLTNLHTRRNIRLLREFSRPIASNCHDNFDLKYLCNENNLEEITKNIAVRKGVGNIKLVNELKSKLDKLDANSKEYNKLKTELSFELNKIPNRTHPDVFNYEEEPKVLDHFGEKRKFEHKPLEFYEITKRLNLARTDQLGNVSGNKSYYFVGQMAQLEQALIQYTLRSLQKNGYKFISVPDILPRHVIESCGMNTRGERTQVI